MALQVIDRAIQSFGAEGVSQDTPLAYAWAVFFAFAGAKMVGFGLKTSADMMADGERGPEA